MPFSIRVTTNEGIDVWGRDHGCLPGEGPITKFVAPREAENVKAVLSQGLD